MRHRSVSDHVHSASIRYCATCAAPLTTRRIDGRQRLICSRCDSVVYFDPKVAAGAIVKQSGHIALIKRAIRPARGKWTFPGGYVDRGEPVAHAAVRETWEETGLRVRIEKLHGVFSYPDVPVVLVVYTASVNEGKLSPGPECEAAAWVLPAAIPWSQLAFPSTGDALRAWISSKEDQ